MKEASFSAERLRRNVEELGEVTVSLGVSTVHEKITDQKDLIQNADEALYRAKMSGRNRVELAEINLEIFSSAEANRELTIH